MNAASSQNTSSFPYAVAAVVAGAAFGIVALLGGPGVAYIIIAILLGLAYSIITIARRQRR